MKPKPRGAKVDNPDVLVWVVKGVPHWFCGHCLQVQHTSSERGLSAAYRHAQIHLWTVHSFRRVWIKEDRPHIEQAAQMTLDLFLGPNTTRHY